MWTKRSITVTSKKVVHTVTTVLLRAVRQLNDYLTEEVFQRTGQTSDDHNRGSKQGVPWLSSG